MGEPKLVDGYVRLYYNSGHRAIFEEWDFDKFVHGALEKIAVWHDGEPYNPGDDEGLRADVLNQTGNLELLRVDEGDHSYTIKGESGEVLATVSFTQKEALPNSTDGENLEKGWLFEHLTKLPANAYPEGDGKGQLYAFQTYESVKVSGDPGFVRFLMKRAH